MLAAVDGALAFDPFSSCPQSCPFALPCCFRQHVLKLKQGHDVDIPQYDFTTHTRRKETKHIQSQKIILVEGILIFTHPDLRDIIDVKVYVDTADDVRCVAPLNAVLTSFPPPILPRNSASFIHVYISSQSPAICRHLEWCSPLTTTALAVCAGSFGGSHGT